MVARRIVLVAEADPYIRQAISDRLSAQGYQVVTAERGSEVLLAVVENAAGLVILGLELQEPAGIKTVEILRKMRPHLPLIVLSGDCSIETGRQVLQHGPLHYLIKPLNLDELDQIVQVASSLRGHSSRPRDNQGAA
jgi:DNA-binding NtrC family response regulator